MTFNDNMGIERELAPGERLLWKGRPQRGIKFRSQDAYTIPFSLILCVFACMTAYGAMTRWPRVGSLSFDFLYFGVLAAFCFYFLIGRFLADAYTRGKMEYALTDRRALIVTNTFGRKGRSIDYRSEPNISLAEHSDGSGTIYFRDPQGKDYGHGWRYIPLEASGSLCGFDRIDNARDVYQRILKAKEAGIRYSELSPSPR